MDKERSENVNSDAQRELGHAIREWRTRHRYTQDMAAKISGIPRSSLRRLEFGEGAKTINFKTLEKLAVILAMTTSELSEKYFSEDNKKDL